MQAHDIAIIPKHAHSSGDSSLQCSGNIFTLFPFVLFFLVCIVLGAEEKKVVALKRNRHKPHQQFFFTLLSFIFKTGL